MAEFFLLKGSDHRLQRKDRPPEQGAPPALDVSQAVLTIAEQAGRISGLCLRATSPESEDGRRISTAEAADLVAATRALIRAAEELRAALGTGISKQG